MSDMPSDPISTCVCNWFDANGSLEIHVFSSDNYKITERYTTSTSGGWVTGSIFDGQQASVTTWKDSAGQHMRLYVTGGGKTTEWCFDPGSTAWSVGQYSTS
ncbi:hypothetical protein [Sphingomonas sp. G-3-2-10]|uniref:hypothetical protein n=1 Tax=Sphingomonas sp. G-3-2-10 TaxID=2728838 RepID=UPI00146F4F31|nr:hypothetical protein [Sphingomonas sp. G-3-2-10]NML07512.1 hypothetical protein [Sphingomonas sp. G-3-2-10]